MSDDLNIESLEYKSEVTEGDSTSATAGDSFRSVIECTEVNWALLEFTISHGK